MSATVAALALAPASGCGDGEGSTRFAAGDREANADTPGADRDPATGTIGF